MEEVVFCEGCHRVLSVEYSYCPYCGREQVAHRLQQALPEGEQEADAPLVDVSSFEEVVDDSFDRVEESVREYTIRRLDEFLSTLGKMENELDAILLPRTPDPADRSFLAASSSPQGVAIRGSASSREEPL